MALRFASAELKNSKSIVITALSSTSLDKFPICPLPYASEELRGDRDVILTSLKYYGRSKTLEYASQKTIASDLELALCYVREDGLFLKNISPELRSNHELVFTAVKQNGHALNYADAMFKNDQCKDLVIEVVKLNDVCLGYVSEAFREDREVVLAAVRSNGGSLLYACEALRNDREVMTAAVHQCGWALAFASQELQNDYNVAMVSTM